MKKMETKKPPAEYKFEYCLGDNQNHGEKFYLANTLNDAVKDFEAFCAETGNELLEWSRDGEVLTITIQKSA